MKPTLALFLAGSSLGLAPVVTVAGTVPQAHASVIERPTSGPVGREQMLRISDDEDDGGRGVTGNGGSSDGGNGGDSSDDCNSDDPACMAGNAAPAGSATPPKNGLFTDGTVPTVKSN